MPPTPLDLPILIAQLPYVAKIAHIEKATPEMQKQLFGPLITKQLLENEEKVQHVDKKEKTSPIDRDGHQNQQSAQFSNKKRKKKKEEDPEIGSSNASPWSGNIINVKI